MKHTGENVVRIEADALRALADRIAGPMANTFDRAVELMDACRGRVVVTGMGKSGIIARKIAATLSSIGTPALFMHPVDAIHGDLGMVVRGDVVLALSASGETEEILRLLAPIKRLQVPLITMTGDLICSQSVGKSARTSTKLSTLAEAADIALDCSVDKEACSLGLAPTASTTTMLALGDALAVALSEKRGFKEEDFANLHPGGKLGKKLARVESLMHGGDAIPRVAATTRMSDVIYEMSRKKPGHDDGGRGGDTPRRHQRRRSPTPARTPRKRRARPHRRRMHDRRTENDFVPRIRRHRVGPDGRKEDYGTGRDRRASER